MKKFILLASFLIVSLFLKSQTIYLRNNIDCNLWVVAGCGTVCSDEDCEVGQLTLLANNTTYYYTAPCTWTSAHKWIYVKFIKVGGLTTGGIDERIVTCGPGEQSYNCGGDIIVSWIADNSVVFHY